MYVCIKPMTEVTRRIILKRKMRRNPTEPKFQLETRFADPTTGMQSSIPRNQTP